MTAQKSFYNVTLSAFVQNYQGYAVGKRDHYYSKAQFVGSKDLWQKNQNKSCFVAD